MDSHRCEHCKDLTDLHITLTGDKISQGAAAGCKSCTLLTTALETFSDVTDIGEVHASVDCALYLFPFTKTSKKLICTIELFVENGKPSQWPNIGPAHHVQPQLTLEDSESLIRKWLRDCQERHASCSLRSATAPKLPKRVIDVGKDDSEVKLYESQPEEAADYIALSHCWGGGRALTSTLAALTRHKKSIKLDENSKTFADAISVTRLLGIRYLWIDSLCIVQDDRQDWASEAPKMKDIYRNAKITLSADSASDASQGLFPPPEARSAAHRNHGIASEGPDGERITVFARSRAANPCNPGSSPHSCLPTEPSKLSTRGWVYQERILSRRMVHFFPEELVWSCYGQQRCECRLTPGASSFGAFRRLLSTPASEQELLRQWPNFVEEFTHKRLTAATDRLPAISGLAALVDEHLPNDDIYGRYLSGIWREDINYSLLWMSDHSKAEEPMQRMQRTYAPSWSWSSVKGPIKYIPRHLDQFTGRKSGDDEIDPILRVDGAFSMASRPTIDTSPGVSSVKITGQAMVVWYDLERKTLRPTGISHDGPALRREPIIIFDVPSELDEIVQYLRLSRQIDRLTTRDEGGGDPYPPGFGTRLIPFMLMRAATYIWRGAYSARSSEVVALLLAVSMHLPGDEFWCWRRGLVLHAFHSAAWQDMPIKTVTIF